MATQQISRTAFRLRLLEIADCNCEFHAEDHSDLGRAFRHNPPCQHVLSADHSVPFVEWAYEIRLNGGADLKPGDYADPDPAPEPTAAMPQTPGKIAVMAWRQENDFSIWHPDDATYESMPQLARTGRRLRNGQDVLGGIITTAEVEAARNALLKEAVERQRKRKRVPKPPKPDRRDAA